jgi:predicted transcriptional regulator
MIRAVVEPKRDSDSRFVHQMGRALEMMRAFAKLSLRVRLGPLEERVLRKLWTDGSATARELLTDGEFDRAYTTVMTTLDRLYKKGLLARVAEGKAFRYTPRYTFEELQRVMAVDNIRQLLGSGDPSSLALSYLVEAISDHDAQLLEDLFRLVERKRRELEGQEGTGEL